MNKNTFIAITAIVSAGAPVFAANAYINQVGFRPSDPKEFSLVGASGNVEIQDASPRSGMQAARMYSWSIFPN